MPETEVNPAMAHQANTSETFPELIGNTSQPPSLEDLEGLFKLLAQIAKRILVEETAAEIYKHAN